MLLSFGLSMDPAGVVQNSPRAPVSPPRRAAAPKSNDIEHLLVRDLTLNSTQQTKVAAIEKKYKAQSMGFMQRLLTRYAPVQKEIQQGPGTLQDKQAKVAQMKQKIDQETKSQVLSMTRHIFGDIDAILTPAQKPQFAKNKAAIMESFKVQFGPVADK